jgi:hypothetical protein
MSTNNPYQAPTAEVSDPVEDGTVLEQVKGGQKLVIYALLAYIAAMLMRGAGLGPFSLVAALSALGMGLVGVYRLSSGLSYSMVVRVIFLILMFVPLVGLLVMLRLNANATTRLRAAGYRVGLLGASR